MARAGRVIAKWCRRGRPAAVLLLVIAAALLAPGAAAAKPSGIYAKFADCPYANPKASKCIYSTTIGGEVDLGSAKVAIVNPVVLQGAYSEPDSKGFAKFIGASDGNTLAPVSQPVPGGLLGIVPPEGVPPLVRAVVAVLFENGLTSVGASLELAGPASGIRLSENNLGGEIGTALELPVMVHLENPLLGPSCYIGSSTSPLTWKLSSGTTSPPKPNQPIKGTVGEIEFLDEGRLTETKGTKLVDNAWATPAAKGCGGVLSFLVNPIVNKSAGLPAAAGTGTVQLENAAFLAPVAVVAKSAEEGE